ncbi:MAG: class I SAM-dependent methyltransferase, partial [Firmicutes bacterium]|nr:class I SAM-dependent methyltransferase [Bacillota bacterium]
MTKTQIEAGNQLVLERFSIYLNDYADFITEEMMAEAMEGGVLTPEEAYTILLAGALNLYDSREIREGWFEAEVPMIHKLETCVYQNNPYYQLFAEGGPFVDGIQTNHGWQLTRKSYKPYEAFVCDDMVRTEDGRLIPQIGFFTEEYQYPCVLHNGREWMLITPNEIETMKRPIKLAKGRVVTYGLGLGYFAFMAASKPEVTEVTVVELDPDVIKLFEENILPGMPEAVRKKIRVVQGDALAYAETLTAACDTDTGTDFVFADIWHDAGDGVDLYLSLKKREKPGILYTYWI